MVRDLLGQKIDFNVELAQLEAKIAELKIQYEQYFLDVLPKPPDELHAELKAMMRKLLKAPFRTSAVNFRLRQLVTRYQTFNTYWQRVLKEREEGTYSRDVFKAELRARAMAEEKQVKRNAQAGSAGFHKLFDRYKAALELSGTNTSQLNYDKFRSSLLKKAKQLKQQYGVQKLTYKVTVKSGKVVVKAVPRT